MSWVCLNFGKHISETLPQIIFKDPDWFIWAIERNVFKNNYELHKEATYLNKLIKKIKIPRDNPEKYEIEYMYEEYNGKFISFEIVPKDHRSTSGNVIYHHKNVIDISMGRQYDYDKEGMKRIIRNLKQYYFEKSGYRMTQDRCEAFFQNKSNFVLS